MSNWLSYNNFVDLIRNHHHNGFSGLITGISTENHSFQIGYLKGNVVLLNYRIFKGQRALEKLTQITRVKVTEHPSRDAKNITVPQSDLPDTNTILSRLTTNLDEEGEIDITEEIPDIPESDQYSTDDMPSIPLSTVRSIPENIELSAIKSAAIHHFGPIGAMVCDEHLSASNLSSTDISTLIQRIAVDVGANDADTTAFLNSLS